jgi:hypothetical protein
MSRRGERERLPEMARPRCPSGSRTGAYIMTQEQKVIRAKVGVLEGEPSPHRAESYRHRSVPREIMARRCGHGAMPLVKTN